MAVIGNLELVVATKAQLSKSLVDTGLWSTEALEVDIDRIWEQFATDDLLQSVNVEVELAVDVNFNEGER